MEKVTLQRLVWEAGTINAVAQALGVAPRTVGYWRAGDARLQDIAFRHVVKLCELTGVELGEVVL